MKIIYNTYIALVVSCLLLAGCDEEDMVDGYGERIEVQFGGGNAAMTKTDPGGNMWAQNDPIGIYMVYHSQSLAPESIAEGGDNVRYKAVPWSTDQSQCDFIPDNKPIYYPVDGNMVDFIAYYPYAPIVGYIYPIDVTLQNYPERIDVLYSNNATGKNKNTGRVDLNFKHLLSKLSFTLDWEYGSTNLTGAKIEITNQPTTASLALSNGLVIATNSGQTISAMTAVDGRTSSAIVIPGNYSNVKLVITLADNVNVLEYKFVDPTFLPGVNQRYHITVGRTGLKVTAGNITVWEGLSDTPKTGQGTTQ